MPYIFERVVPVIMDVPVPKGGESGACPPPEIFSNIGEGGCPPRTGEKFTESQHSQHKIHVFNVDNGDLTESVTFLTSYVLKIRFSACSLSRGRYLIKNSDIVSARATLKNISLPRTKILGTPLPVIRRISILILHVCKCQGIRPIKRSVHNHVYTLYNVGLYVQLLMYYLYIKVGLGL